MIVGLTGGIGSGKSTAAKMFRELGITVVDADQVARDVVAPGTTALGQIAEKFGPSILTPEGTLNRAELRDRIQQNESDRAWLENLLHPLIRTGMLEQLEQAISPYAILEAPLLFENGLDQHCQRTVLMDVSEQQQKARAAKRDERSESDIEKMMAYQWTQAQRKAKADYLLDNTLDEEHLHNHVLRLDQILRVLANNPEFQ